MTAVAHGATFGTLFAGGGGADLGLRAAGLTPRWAIEHDSAIAGVYQANLGDHLIVASVEDVDFAALAPVDVLWASPPCPGFSVARRGDLGAHGSEHLGLLVPRYAEATGARVVLIENVPPYAKSAIFLRVVSALWQQGYLVDWQVVNCADYGVPQTRRRLIMRAVRGALLPSWPEKLPWVGWYAAVADLLPTLPESSFVPWQVARLKEWAHSFLLMTGNTRMTHPTGSGVLPVPRPANTVMPASGAARAWLVDSRMSPVDDERPAFTVTTHTLPRALLVQSKNISQQWGSGFRGDEEPAFTIVTDGKESHAPKAFLVSGTDATVRAGFPSGCVVVMTPRALARFMAFPDTYTLPAHRGLACKILGNAVPPPLARRVVERFASVLATCVEGVV